MPGTAWPIWLVTLMMSELATSDDAVVNEALRIIDEALSEYGKNSIVPGEAFKDCLLDLRILIVSKHKEEPVAE